MYNINVFGINQMDDKKYFLAGMIDDSHREIIRRMFMLLHNTTFNNIESSFDIIELLSNNMISISREEYRKSISGSQVFVAYYQNAPLFDIMIGKAYGDHIVIMSMHLDWTKT